MFQINWPMEIVVVNNQFQRYDEPCFMDMMQKLGYKTEITNNNCKFYVVCNHNWAMYQKNRKVRI